MKKRLLLLVFIVFLTFLYSCSCTILHGDAVWNYGFSYNISQGMIIYRDFNVMQTPLFFFVCSLFINIFGNYLYVIHLVCAIEIGIVMAICFKIIKYKAFIVYPVVLFFYIPSYNFMCLMLLFIIIYLINTNRDNDILMGFIISLIFLTKQSVGILLIPGFFYSKNKLKFLISFIIPILLLFIYLIYNDCLYKFIDYCFLGLLDFNNSNMIVSIFLLFEIIVIGYLVYKIIIRGFRDKEIVYILMFQIISYPIFDLYHFSIVFIPVVYYFVKGINNLYGNIIICFMMYCLLFSIFVNKPYMNMDKNYLYLINDNYGEYSSLLDDEKKIINNYVDDYDYVFYIMGNAYFRKLYFGEKIGQYDFLLSGNMGYNGDARIINDIRNICENNSCVFFVDDIVFNDNIQFSIDIYNYVKDNYEAIDSNKYFDIYSNG